ncbi:cytochrome P450 [Bradyrhizobium monzae]|uniref:cytochrome P450 n=1 Tax=Bradyrhizobium sp. Oc8 TaxID=2876780 RepID=UPI001F1F2065|nr:cytochrome P450 [Bradyrhizobium sp. Oc8]
MDNVFIERLRRLLKHEDIYLKHYAAGREEQASDFVARVIQRRAPPPSPCSRTPMEVLHEGMAAGRAVKITLRLHNAAVTHMPRAAATTADSAVHGTGKNPTNRSATVARGWDPLHWR